MLKKVLLTAAVCAVMPLAVKAAQPQGFANQPAAGTAPQGLTVDQLTSVRAIRDKGRDEQMVVLKGRFTKQLGRELYEFTDTNGDTIACELDDDRNWSHVRKDALVEISAEIDKGYTKLELEVIEARPIK